ncbi:MerR family transcriptional regulator, partial [Citrobacter sp. AAK_AS5]
EPLKIGAFSTLSRLSVRMLRYYDSHGVLSPASIDQWTGYRYYEASQLPDAVLVRQWRDVGFSVSAIAALLPLRNDPETLDR